MPANRKFCLPAIYSIVPLFALIACAGLGTTVREPAEVRSCERIFETTGPSLRIALPGFSPSSLQKKKLGYLRIAQYSLRQYHVDERPETERITSQIVETIQRERPDILFLSEVKTEESARYLAYRLDNQFEPVLVRGNDESAIDVAVLIRKSLTIEVDIQSHRALTHELDGGKVPLFSRDLILLSLRVSGDVRPVLSIADSHFKADLSARGDLPERRFREKREAQELASIEILEANKNAVRPRGSIMMGDLNADARLTSEFLHLKNAGYREALDVLGIPMNKRVTHTGFSMKNSEPRGRQPDAVFLSQEIVMSNALVAGYVVTDRDRNGNNLPAVKNFQQRAEHASDHKMLIVEVDLRKLR